MKRLANDANVLPACAPDIRLAPGCTHARSGIARSRSPVKSPAASFAIAAPTAAASASAVIFGSLASAVVAPGIAAPKNSSTFFATISRSLSTQTMW